MLFGSLIIYSPNLTTYLWEYYSQLQICSNKTWLGEIQSCFSISLRAIATQNATENATCKRYTQITVILTLLWRFVMLAMKEEISFTLRPALKWSTRRRHRRQRQRPAVESRGRFPARKVRTSSGLGTQSLAHGRSSW